MPHTSRGDAAIRWIEKFCLVPDGPDKGKRVKLTAAQRFDIRRIYNAGGPQGIPVTGVLAAWLALLHTCGIEAPGGGPRPDLDVDTALIFVHHRDQLLSLIGWNLPLVILEIEGRSPPRAPRPR